MYRFLRTSTVPLLAGLALALGGATAQAQFLGGVFGGGCAGGSCGGGGCASSHCVPCQRHHCPPRFRHCLEGPPRLCYKRGCAKPVCNPCDLEHYGYYETCWRPWPFPPNWNHCPVPGPQAFVGSGGPPPVVFGGEQLSPGTEVDGARMRSTPEPQLAPGTAQRLNFVAPSGL